jgi:hypothetical protein
MNEKDMNEKLHQAGQNVHPEAKTVVNGKVVPVQDALQAEQSMNQQAKQTGVNESHNNNTEAVQAGATSQNAQGLQQNQEVQNIKQTNVQSGQAELEKQLKSSVSGYNIETNQEPTKAPKAKAKNQEGQ